MNYSFLGVNKLFLYKKIICFFVFIFISQHYSFSQGDLDHEDFVELIDQNKSERETKILDSGFSPLGRDTSLVNENLVYLYKKIDSHDEFIETHIGKRTIFYFTSEKDRYVELKKDLDQTFKCNRYDEDEDVHLTSFWSCYYLDTEPYYTYKFSIFLSDPKTIYGVLITKFNSE